MTAKTNFLTSYIFSVLTFIALVLFIVKMDGCTKEQTIVVKTYDSSEVSHTFTKGDTTSIAPVKLIATDTIYVPRIYSHTYFDTITLAPDTAAIIKAWLHTANYFVQEIRDSDVYILIQDTIYQNEIVWRNVDRKILRPTTVTIHTPTPKPRVKIYAGGQLGLSRHALGVMPGLMIIDRKSRAFTIGYDLTHSNPQNVTVGFFYPIKN